MKTLLILMILFSLFVGVSINGEWTFLFRYEFPDMVSMIKSGKLSSMEVATWVILLISHLGVISLLFLTKSEHFKSFLIVMPLLFVITYMLSSFLLSLLLIPFIIVWIISLNKSNDHRQPVNVVN